MNPETLNEMVEKGGWTLFLDRDGVINVRKMDGYIERPEEFEFLPGVEEWLEKHAGRFKRVLVVTNQRGIARRLMTEEDLEVVHQKMKERLALRKVEFDGIYHCPHDRDSGCRCRKPGPGLVEQALSDFPEIELKKSILIGDTQSDMQLGRSFGMVTVLVGEEEIAGEWYDVRLEGLQDLWS